MKATGPDELVDVPPEEIERLTLVQKNQIGTGDDSAKVSLIHKKETIRLKLLFGAGSHWTMIYDLDSDPSDASTTRSASVVPGTASSSTAMRSDDLDRRHPPCTDRRPACSGGPGDGLHAEPGR